MMKISVFDIGGANIKKMSIEDGKISSSLHYFPLWKRKEGELTEILLNLSGSADLFAVTMTGELSDVFTSKKNGVEFIVNSCSKAVNEPFFLTNDELLLKKEDITDYNSLAATNWLASLYFMRKRFGSGILLDIGSTTTDLLPFGTETVLPNSDLNRLISSNLLYTGLLRTPISALVSEVPFNGVMVPIASEYFAITADAYNILFDIDYTCETPDGRGKSKNESKARIARLLCADLDEIEGDIEGICNFIFNSQARLIANPLRKVWQREANSKVYVAGVGKLLGMEAAKMIGCTAVDLEKEVHDSWNLPCHGLMEMVLDMDGGSKMNG